MTYDPKKHHRRSIRLKGYDYSSPGNYFLNLCAQNRECRYGTIINEKMVLNTAGRMVDKWWNKIPEKFPNAVLDVYQIMPNHFHAIVGIIKWNPKIHSKNVGVDPRVNPDENNDQNSDGYVDPPQRKPDPPRQEPEFETRPASVDGIAQWFKTMTTNEYIRGVKDGIYPPFDRRVWQRNYYESIIRHEKSLERIRHYIINNPAKWEEDRNNPGKY